MKKAFGVLLGVFLSGCATILSGTSQSIHVKVVEKGSSEPLPGVSCQVFDGAGGSYALTSNPGTTSVSRAQGGVRVECQKKGFKQLNTAVGDSFNVTTLVNVLFWPGFIVDAASGAYKRYPSHYVVNMEKT